MKCKNLLLLSLFLLGSFFSAKAQSVCQPNLDFELGNYSNWNYYRGTNTDPSGTAPVWTLTPCTPVWGLHTLKGFIPGETDTFGGFPVVADGLYSLKIGKDSTLYNADGADYHIHVPSCSSCSYSLIYRYAVVFEDPGHLVPDQPRFEIDTRDSATGTAILCNTFTFISSSILPGFLTSTVTDIGGNKPYYKPWTAGSLNLTSYPGKTIIASFKAGGCTQSGHWGYAYIDMNCGIFKIQTVGCSGGKAELEAPPGYASYQWTDSLTFLKNYGTTVKVIVSVPTITTTYAVILFPYAGYGCADTLYARLVPSNMVTHPSHDTAICQGQTVKMWGGATDILSLTYAWVPVTGVSCSTCDTTMITPPVGNNHYKITTYNTGGCLHTDTINITVYPTAAPIGGNPIICQGSSTTVTNSVPGGTWTSSSALVSVGSATGVVASVGGLGTAIITYSFSGICGVTKVVSVVALPPAITGPGLLCIGSTATLSDAGGAGTWSSSTTSIATIGSGTGIVTGVNAGTSTISFTSTASGCSATRAETVIPVPAIPTGKTTICQYDSTKYVSTGTGTWVSSNPAVGSIDPVSGELYALTAGTTTLTYTVGTGCFTTTTVKVIPSPDPISGPLVVCAGYTITLSDAAAGGSWSSSSTGVATVGSSDGIVTGAGVPSSFTAIITYSYPTSCNARVTVTVNPLPAVITAPANICLGQTAAVSSATAGGAWSSNNSNATFASPAIPIVTGAAIGSSVISYTLPTTGCFRTNTVTIVSNPAPITGSTGVCVGGTTCFSDATSGGKWTITPGTVASVGATTGCVTGIASGTATLTYTLLSTGCYSTYVINVNPKPSPITGTSSICAGSTTALTDASPGGLWTSSNLAVGTIDAGGIVTGMASGTTTISYAVGSGCAVTYIVTVNPAPGAIVGATGVCTSATTNLTDGTLGGTWSSSNPGVGTISATGVVTGITTGTTTITYKLLTGCLTTTTVTVGPGPVAISGPATVCAGLTIGLSDAVGGGSWTSIKPSVASVDPFSGVVTGITAGTTTISYSLGGSCTKSMIVTVLPAAPPITGIATVCVGSTTLLSNATSGGTWSSSDPTTATVSGVGLVSGVLAGTSTITYSAAAGCPAVKVVTVNPLPAAIGGPIEVCVGATVTLTDATTGGIWTSSTIAIGNVGAGTGVLTGYSFGTTTITYKLSATGCAVTAPATVNPLPAAISGPASVCYNSSITLSDATLGGTWSTASTLISLSGATVTGTSATGGSAIVSYTTPSGCFVKAAVRVDPLPAPISGSPTVCVGANITLSDATSGGTWSSGGSAVSINSTTGVVTGGASGCAPIFYTVTATGCQQTTTVCISSSPGAIGGTSSACIGLTTTLSDAAAGGTWTSGNTAIATVDAAGIVTGKAAGTAVITYALGTGCFSTRIVTINPLPSTIVNPGPICLTASPTLSDGTPGGTWSSSDPAVATIDPVTGVITPMGVGTSTIVYFVGCPASITVTVNPSPAAITGPGTICSGSSITLSDAVSGPGVTIWSSSNPAVATVVSSGPGTATVTGGTTSGVATISYTLGGTCFATHSVTVYPVATITGSSVCEGAKLTMTTTIPGTWSSSAPTTASVTPTTGIVSGITAGTAIITLTLPSGCITTQVITVGATPGAITGPLQVCKTSTITLSDASTGGTWSSSATATATVTTATGDVYGVNNGTARITYTLSSGCSATTIVTVNPLPAAISGAANICALSTVTLTTTTTGGKWSSSVATVANIGSTTGIVTAGVPGTAIINYTLPTGCLVSKIITVNALPAPITGPTSICKGSTTTLANTAAGTWTSSAISIAPVVSGTGVVSGFNPGTATITFTATASGCTTSTTVTVFPIPAAIGVPRSVVCVGDAETLTNTTLGGSWSVSDASIATISSAGVFTAVGSGTVLVYYSVASGCSATPVSVIVNPSTKIIGNNIVCVGQTTIMIDTTIGGTWSSSASGVASVGAATGAVTGKVTGTAIISYTTTKGCVATQPVTVNLVPAGVTGPNQLCLGQVKTYNALTPSGVWSSSVTSVATITGTGGATGVTLGTSVISYTIKGCAATFPVTVNPLPAPITGNTDVCVGGTTTLTDATGVGTWTSSRVLFATAGLSSGIITGVNTGTSTISYTVSATGCYANTDVNVHPNPLPVFGPSQVCVGSTILLTDPTPGGTWVSLTPAFASVSFGLVTGGASSGTAIIAYMLPTGCSAQHVVTVNPLPAPISTSQICEAARVTLTSSPSGGAWTSSTPSVATVGLTSGSAFGVIAGTTTVDYTLPTGCLTSEVLTVNPLPAPVTGPSSVCVGNVASFTSATAGGNWSTDNAAVATPDVANNGDINGLSAGLVNVSYTIPTTSCSVAVGLVVTDKPSPIGGNTTVCYRGTSKFTNTVSGGTWKSDDVTIATIDPVTGVATGIATGTTIITYSMSTNCDATVIVTVVPLPTAFTVTGGGNTCAGTGVPVGLNGSTVGINYYLYVGGSVATGPLAGTGIPLNFGPQLVGGSYSVVGVNAISACSSNMLNNVIINVNPILKPTVNVATGTGDTMVCNGATTVLTATTTNAGSSPLYKWDINGTVVSVSNAPYSYIPADGDVVTFTLTSSALCAVPAIVSNHVTLKVVPPATPFATLSADPGDTVCQGLAVTFTPTPTYGGTKPVYTWIVNTVPVTSGPTFTYVPADLDVVYAKITSNYPCLVTPNGVSNTVRMKVQTPIIPHVSITADPGTNVAPGQPVTLTAVTTDAGAAPGYQWMVNGIPVATATSSVYTFTNASTNVSGHSDSISVAVMSSGFCTMGTHQWVYITEHNVGVKQLSAANSNINVLPNPNKGEFTVSGALGTNNDEEVSLEITDLLGQVVYKSKVVAKGGNLDAHVTLRNTLANGMYMLNVRSETASQVFHVVIEQ